jgi:HNH endonuclease
MPCIFCRSEDNLTDEHVFPAFMGGELEVRNGSCKHCNGDFGVAEGILKEATTPLLNLLQIKNRYDVVPNAPLNVQIRGMDLKNLPAYMDGNGEIRLLDTVKESTDDDGRRLRQGFFLTKEAGAKFVERARAKGLQVIEREVPTEIVIEANYTLTIPFAFCVEARKVVSKIALTAIAYEYGIPFALSPQFNALRQARVATGDRDLRVWVFANEGLMGAHIRTAHQHSVMCYMSAGMHKGWAVVTLFGGVTYCVYLTTDYTERQSKQFSIFYDADSKRRMQPILLADEMTLIGHVLSPASKFEDRDAVDAQWYPIISAFCAEKGITIERIGGKHSGTASPQV